MFEFTPWTYTPTDLCAVGQYHQDIENTVRSIVNKLREYGLCVPAYMVDEELEKNNIDYVMLPQHLKDLIDELDVY